MDGFTPSATYLGSLGYCLELALRPGVQHSALETELNLERVLPMAAKLIPLSLLFRADSGLLGLVETIFLSNVSIPLHGSQCRRPRRKQ